MTDGCSIGRDVPRQQQHTLRIVLAINTGMFAVEFAAGLVAHSTALLADSVDMLGDALVYGFSLYAVGRGPHRQAQAALLKGAVMAAFALGVLGEVGLKIARGLVPVAEVMGGVGLLALAANGAVLLILGRHRADDINMRSAWLCSRNDVIANVGVLLAALAVAAGNSAWPDIVIGLLIAGMFGTSAVGVMRGAWRQRRSVTMRPA